MKLKKGIPLIDQHDQHGFWGGKFGGSFIPETLKKPVEDLTNEFKKLSTFLLVITKFMIVHLMKLNRLKKNITKKLLPL